MITIKAMWLYVALAMSAAGGGGAVLLIAPSRADIESAVRLAQNVRECELPVGRVLGKSGYVDRQEYKGY